MVEQGTDSRDGRLKTAVIQLGSRVLVPLSAGRFSFLGIIVEWPKITQIAAIISSDGTYNVICV